jgi:predicted ATPase/DNA-binding SARP family transcriptional activator
MNNLKLFLLGPPQVELGDRSLNFSRRKTLALLIYLAVTGAPQRRDTLATLLWPDSPQSQARASLSRDLSILSKMLGQGWLVADRETVSLYHGRELWLDLAQFQQRVAERQSHGHPSTESCVACLNTLAAAASLYRDGFLTGFTLQDSPDFDDWQLFQAERLRQELAEVLVHLAQGYAGQGEFKTALTYAQRWLSLDSLHEPAHRTLMQLYIWLGDRTAALRQYQECARLLQRELDLPPSSETIQLYETIKTEQERDDLFSPAPLPSAPPHNLPTQTTPFVGREKELTDIITRLKDPTCRLLTLVGPGGIGKTRLALQAAWKIGEAPPDERNFTNGLYFVPLVSATSSNVLVLTIADVFNLSFYTTEPKQPLLDYLREKVLLLILDNFEQLLLPSAGGIELIAEILQMTPTVKLLVTSHEPLNLQEEWVYPVAGLSFPEDQTLTGVAPETYGAVQLFAQCAWRARPDFSLAAEQAHVLQICRRVEGMPLGLELAAAWLKIFSCAKVAQEIEASFDFLAASFHNLPLRHRSMRAVFEYSWQLLSEAERQVFRQLSLFRGGFRLEAAEQVAGASLPLLVRLIEKSLVRWSQSDRYQLHELLRQFATEKLQAFPQEKVQSQNRHCDYYATFLNRQQARLTGKEQQAALLEIGEEIENIRAAWDWAIEQGQVENITLALSSLYDFYYTRSWFQEGKEAFGRAAQSLRSKIGAESPLWENPKSKILWGRLIARYGAFHGALGFYDQAQELLQTSLTITRDHDTPQEIAFSLNILGEVKRDAELLEARQLFQESLAISQKIGYQTEVIASLYGLGETALQEGALSEAKRLFQQVLALAKEAERLNWIARALDKVATAAFALGEYLESEQYYQESRDIFKDIGNQFGLAMALGGIGWAAQGQGGTKLKEAKLHWWQSMTICREIGHRHETGCRLTMVARVENSLGEYQVARQHCQEALIMVKETDEPYSFANSLIGLGEAVCGLGEYQAAKEYLSEGVTVAMNALLPSCALDALGVWAVLLAKEGNHLAEDDPARQAKKAQALQLLSLVLHHPTTWQLDKDRVAPLLAELEAELPLEVTIAAGEKGKTQSLEEAVAELLAEMEREENPDDTDFIDFLDPIRVDP